MKPGNPPCTSQIIPHSKMAMNATYTTVARTSRLGSEGVPRKFGPKPNCCSTKGRARANGAPIANSHRRVKVEKVRVGLICVSYVYKPGQGCDKDYSINSPQPAPSAHPDLAVYPHSQRNKGGPGQEYLPLNRKGPKMLKRANPVFIGVIVGGRPSGSTGQH